MWELLTHDIHRKKTIAKIYSLFCQEAMLVLIRWLNLLKDSCLPTKKVVYSYLFQYQWNRHCIMWTGCVFLTCVNILSWSVQVCILLISLNFKQYCCWKSICSQEWWTVKSPFLLSVEWNLIFYFTLLLKQCSRFRCFWTLLRYSI